MSSSSFLGGETIQLSFGPAANAITSHLCNLQGLASTTSNSDNGVNDDSAIAAAPLCDPYVTHSIQNDIYVPRVVFVDGRNHFSPWASSSSSSSSSAIPAPGQDAITANANATMNTNINSTNWEGAVDIHHRVPNYNIRDDMSRNGTNININSSMNSNDHHNHNRNHNHHSYFVDNSPSTYNANQLSKSQRDAWHQFQSLASSTVSSVLNDPHSRYHSSKYQHVSSQYIYSHNNNNNNERYVQWDDEEEEEDDEEEEYYKQRKLRLDRQRWDQREEALQNELDTAWDKFFDGGNGNHGNESDMDGNGDNTGNTATRNPLHHIQWLNYFMPPHPKINMFTAPLPFDHIISNTTNGQPNNPYQDQPILHSHYCGKYSSSSYSSTVDGITSEWREDLSDKIRKWMEDCDALRGVQIMVDNDKSLYGGLATSVLEELSDECRSAGKVSVLVHDGDDFDSLNVWQRGAIATTGGDGETKERNGNGINNGKADKSSYWRSERKVVHSFRSHLNHGLNFHGITENSDLILPLSLNQCWNSLGRQTNSSKSEMTLFEASAAGALALESMTLPYRLLKQPAVSQSFGKRTSKIGIMSGYFQGSGQSDDNDAFPTADKLSYHEFISSLRPSNRHTVLELAGSSTNNQKMDERLLQGTSVEKRRLEEERERNRNSMYYRRSRGRDIDPGLWIEDNGPNGGILYPLSPSPNGDKLTSRSIHRHFSMMTALRSKGTTTIPDQVSTYTTMIMEGMGIRYRPQSSVSTVLKQSVYDLTSSKSYAAGTYWKSIFSGQIQNVPVLTVLGNSTRSYSHLKITAHNISQSLSRKYQGYLSRDSTAGIVPEKEDCTDALEHIMDLRDTYEPPMMFDDEDHEGTYFEDNSE